MTPTPDSTRSPSRQRLISLVVTVDFLIILLPPLHWWFGNGQVLPALGYFLGSSLVVAASLPLLAVLDYTGEK